MSIPPSRSIGAAWGSLPGIVRLNLVAMAGFNAGFSLVIPFLAVHMTVNLHLGAALVGLILGARMAAQQGLFVFGGALSDRFGAKPMIVLGLSIRIIGLVLLGIAPDPVSLIVGVVLVGGAAALFAPAVEATNASYGRLLHDEGRIARTDLFAVEQVFSRIGTAVGPAVGTLLLPVPFIWTTAAASVIYATLLVAFVILLPGENPKTPIRQTLVGRLLEPLRNGPFLCLAVVGSLHLAALNLFFVLLPLHVSAELVGYFFIGSALVVIFGQRPLRAVTGRLSTTRLLVGGYTATGMAFAVPALLAVPAVRSALWASVAVLATWTVLLQVGQMMLVPATRDAVARVAGERSLGSHYGMFATVGGFLALAVSWAVGMMIDLGEGETLFAWLATAGFFVAVAAVIALARVRGALRLSLDAS